MSDDELGAITEYVYRYVETCEYVGEGGNEAVKLEGGRRESPLDIESTRRRGIGR